MPCVNPPKGLPCNSKDCCRSIITKVHVQCPSSGLPPCSRLDSAPPHPCCQRLEARTAGRRIHHGPGLRVGGGGCSTGHGRDGCPSGGGWRDFGRIFRAPMLFLVIALIRFMHQKLQLAIKSLGVLQAWVFFKPGRPPGRVVTVRLWRFLVSMWSSSRSSSGPTAVGGMADKQNSPVRHGNFKSRVNRAKSEYDTGQSLMSSPNNARPDGHRERRDVHCACPPI